MYRGIIERYRKFLPVDEKTPVVSLHEGATPLVPAPWLSKQIGADIYLKYEGLNPTGSFKDRGMTLAMSKAKERGAKAVICASTGNTSASAAAYARRAGMKCVVLIPDGAIALGKLSQALIHDAKVLAIKGNFDTALKMVLEVSRTRPIALVNSLNPDRLEGQKTGAFEICDDLKAAPDFHAMPVGNAGNITAYWKGYNEYFKKKIVKSLPVMLGFQAAGAAPIVLGKPVMSPKTIATAIRIGNPASWKLAEEARDQSGGLIEAVTDKEIMAAYKILAAEEGLFVEPASAAGVAGLLKLKASNDFFGKFEKTEGRRAVVTVVLTGHGLKDPGTAMDYLKKPKTVKPDVKAILKEVER